MILFTIEEAVRCADRCAECGDIPCWQAVEDCAPCEECAASVDTHPQDGDVEQAPLVSGAVPNGQTPKGGSNA